MVMKWKIGLVWFNQCLASGCMFHIDKCEFYAYLIFFVSVYRYWSKALLFKTVKRGAEKDEIEEASVAVLLSCSLQSQKIYLTQIIDIC